jgi:hypothetical protein
MCSKYSTGFLGRSYQNNGIYMTVVLRKERSRTGSGGGFELMTQTEDRKSQLKDQEP